MPVSGSVFQPRSPDLMGRYDNQGGRGGATGEGGREAQTLAGKTERERDATDNASVNRNRGNWGRVGQVGWRQGDKDTIQGRRGDDGRCDGIPAHPGRTTPPGGLRRLVTHNPGTHLDGGVRNDLAWQVWWRDLVVMPSRRYDAPSGKVGQRFVRTLGEEIKGVQEIRWNSERFIIFQTVILQQAHHVTASQAIRQRIEKRLDAWGKGMHAMLVEDTTRSCEEYVTVAQREDTTEHRAQTYHSLVLRSKL